MPGIAVYGKSLWLFAFFQTSSESHLHTIYGSENSKPGWGHGLGWQEWAEKAEPAFYSAVAPEGTSDRGNSCAVLNQEAL